MAIRLQTQYESKMCVLRRIILDVHGFGLKMHTDVQIVSKLSSMHPIHALSTNIRQMQFMHITRTIDTP